jgi:hypothetical protein
VGKIKSFKDFSKSLTIQESDGFGTLPYLEKRDGNIYYYFFKLDSEGEKEQKGYMLTIGKYSQYEDTPGAKNSYSVLNVNEIGTELVDDIAIDKQDIPNLNDTIFNLSDSQLSRFLEQCAKAVGDYLEQNSKVVRFYDEMQTNIDAKNYLEFLKSVVAPTNPCSTSGASLGVGISLIWLWPALIPSHTARLTSKPKTR